MTEATPLFECVPNFSEGRRTEVVQSIWNAIAAVPDVRVLNLHMDADHNRSVITFIGTPEAVEEAALQAAKTAAALIDLRQHQGEHPRIGATDVIPFIPLEGATFDDAVHLARRVARRLAEEVGIPTYLYGAAAQHPERRRLADIRRGGYEALVDAIQHDPARVPDFGPTALGPAGATAVGARDFLIAWNVFLTTSDVSIAERIARAVRHSSGGLRGVQALGMLVDGRAQVSMNLTDFRHTPLPRVMEMIRREAARYGVLVERSELVGLLPLDAVLDTAAWYLQLDTLTAEEIIETHVWRYRCALPEG
ncbi:MAG: glutamate formimidoyltransferase [Ardenticatenia bacterium]|nr:MAG: glutamate formimidoyltransferase [Ardenticatenia bacterium]